jgi:hypothetical protein
MKGIMGRVQRGILTVLLAIQVLGGGAVSLAHARDVVTAPAAFESHHDARCPVLHDALRCALCHYAGAQVGVQRTVAAPASCLTSPRVPSARQIVLVSGSIHRTAPARAPPAFLS